MKSDNLLLLIVFWELTSISSFLLVGYWQHRADARSGARMALAVTGASTGGSSAAGGSPPTTRREETSSPPPPLEGG